MEEIKNILVKWIVGALIVVGAGGILKQIFKK